MTWGIECKYCFTLLVVIVTRAFHPWEIYCLRQPTCWDLFSGELLASCYSVLRAIDSRSSAHSASTEANIISCLLSDGSSPAPTTPTSRIISPPFHSTDNAWINSSGVNPSARGGLIAAVTWAGDKWQISEAVGGRPEQLPFYKPILEYKRHHHHIANVQVKTKKKKPKTKC